VVLIWQSQECDILNTADFGYAQANAITLFTEHLPIQHTPPIWKKLINDGRVNVYKTRPRYAAFLLPCVPPKKTPKQLINVVRALALDGDRTRLPYLPNLTAPLLTLV
jgi:hypothetical protein